MRPLSVIVLCVISAGIGAGIDHYWDRLPPIAGMYWNKLRSFAGSSNAPEIEQKTANPSGGGSIEVLGDRVKCDNRYIELKIPESEYRAFFDQCMGNTAGTKKVE
jgi:hypothetical protein